MKITTEYLRFAPKSMSWCAIDADNYDGAPDATGESHSIGQGPTEFDAVVDLIEQLKYWRKYEARTVIERDAFPCAFCNATFALPAPRYEHEIKCAAESVR